MCYVQAPHGAEEVNATGTELLDRFGHMLWTTREQWGKTGANREALCFLRLLTSRGGRSRNLNLCSAKRTHESNVLLI